MPISLANQIVDKCLRINEKDNVTVFFYQHMIPLDEEISTECFKKGADVLLNLYTDKYLMSYMNELSVESLREPSVFCKALTENSTAEIWMGGTYDPSILWKIPPEKNIAASEGEAKAHWPLFKEKRVKNLNVNLAQTGRRLKEALSGASSIRVTGRNGTDLSFDVSGRKWRISDGVLDENDM